MSRHDGLRLDLALVAEVAKTTNMAVASNHFYAMLASGIIGAFSLMVVAYLRKETLTLSSEVPRGYVLACYQGHPMGFLNNLGSRANNLYTTEWRIRTKTL